MHSKTATLTAPAASILALLLFAANARADDPGELDEGAERSPPATRARGWGLPPAAGTAERDEGRSWYGNQLIISDGIFVGLLLLASADAMVSCLSFGGPPLDADQCSNANTLGLVAIGGMAFVPAIIHLAHGRVLAAGASLALRVAVPLLINALGFPAVAVFAWLFGAIIDDAVLSREPSPSAPEWQPATWPLSRDH